MKTKTFAVAFTVAGLMFAPFTASLANGVKLPPVKTEDGVSTQTASASDAFPGLKGFLSLPASERSQIDVYYVARIKRANKAQVKIALIDGGRQIPLNVQGDGRITPLPTLAQLNSGAKITISGPATGSYAMKIHVRSTQPQSTTYDAAGLALGIRQGNAAVGKIAGPVSFMVKKLDRVYFVGGGNGTVEIGGQQKSLPRTTAAGEYPAGTPYFQPASFPGATRIKLSHAPSSALFDNPPK